MILFAFLHLLFAASAAASYDTELSMVNILRRVNQAPPLTYSSDFGAQAWADYLASTNKLVHSPTGFGENLAQTFNLGVDWTLVINSWYAEGKQYNYSYNRFNASTGHFTQLVWCKSNMIDFGAAMNGSATFYVTRFAPPGNVGGQYLENVKPPMNKPLNNPPVNVNPPVNKPPYPKPLSQPPYPKPLLNPPPICNQPSCRPKRSCNCICS